ncbi:MAG: riboflavin synthase [bacterium]
MFTGIIEQLGTIAIISPGNPLTRLLVEIPERWNADLQLGESIAVNGICLTVAEISSTTMLFEAMPETVQKTAMANWKDNQQVNLERACLAQTRLGGHIVSGHVDGVGMVKTVAPDERGNRIITITVDRALVPFLASKGSVTVDGVSLTIIDCKEDHFTVGIIPHTWEHTILQTYTPQIRVNIEVDTIARYVVHAMRYLQQKSF